MVRNHSGNGGNNVRPATPTRQMVKHLLCVLEGESGRRVLEQVGEPPAAERAVRESCIAVESHVGKYSVRGRRRRRGGGRKMGGLVRKKGGKERCGLWSLACGYPHHLLLHPTPLQRPLCSRNGLGASDSVLGRVGPKKIWGTQLGAVKRSACPKTL
jgi:hypothetical protein